MTIKIGLFSIQIVLFVFKIGPMPQVLFKVQGNYICIDNWLIDFNGVNCSFFKVKKDISVVFAEVLWKSKNTAECVIRTTDLPIVELQR